MAIRNPRRGAPLVVLVFVTSLFSASAPSAADVRVDPVLRMAAGPTEVFVHARSADVRDAIRALGAAGATVEISLPSVGVAYATLHPLQIRRLAADPRVSYVEASVELEYHTDVSHKVTQGDLVYSIPVTDGQGRLVDGRGIGVAVIDSGVDATHPDLEPNVVENFKIVAGSDLGRVSLPNTDQDSGHGTHVAGTVAGTGGASEGTFTGAARGASIYGVGAGLGLHMLRATMGLEWVLEHHDTVDPPIRVVNSSWGQQGGGRHNPDGVISKLSNELVAAGVVLVWSAGNYSGDGSETRTSPYGTNPTPGNIAVANASAASGQRHRATLSSSSSRGALDDPSTWPDITAPGTGITAACRLTFPVCHLHLGQDRQYPNLYAALSGTSMAAPHVAGIVAQILQVDPEFEPGEVEEILKATAFKFTAGGSYVHGVDPAYPDGSTSFDKGHGMVDVLSALELACEKADANCSFEAAA